jgi:hypothetical protein
VELVFYQLQRLQLIEADLELGIDDYKIFIGNEPNEMVLFAVALVDVDRGLLLEGEKIVDFETVDPFGTVFGELSGDDSEFVVGFTHVHAGGDVGF